MHVRVAVVLVAMPHSILVLGSQSCDHGITKTTGHDIGCYFCVPKHGSTPQETRTELNLEVGALTFSNNLSKRRAISCAACFKLTMLPDLVGSSILKSSP